MLTIFSTAKPFKGHAAIIQRNAITSWTLLHPRPEIVLFGDEEGAAEICRELKLRHIPNVALNEFGTPLLNDLFENAQRLATHDLLCYVNADIILMSDFLPAIARVSQSFEHYLMIGHRWDVAIGRPLGFREPHWEEHLRKVTERAGQLTALEVSDYFAFRKGMFTDIVPFAIGRGHWDRWLIWFARCHHAAIVDASPAVTVVHQWHDYSHVSGGGQVFPENEEWQRNQRLLGGWNALDSIAFATHYLTPHGLRRAWVRPHLARLKRRLRYQIYYPLLTWTRPVRHRLGIRREA